MKKEIKLLQIDKEELEKVQEKDLEIMNDEDAVTFQKDAATERVEWRDKEIARITTQLEEIKTEEIEERPLLERVKDIFKKYGVTLTAIFLAVGVTIRAVIGTLTRGLKASGKALGNGLKALSKKNRFPAAWTPRGNRELSIQSRRTSHRFSGRAHLAADFGGRGLPD